MLLNCRLAAVPPLQTQLHSNKLPYVASFFLVGHNWSMNPTPATVMGKQFTLHVSIQVAPKNVDAFLEALRPAWAGVVAEPENLFFDVFQSQETPGLFRFVEVWSKGKDWFLTVRQSPITYMN